MTGHKTPRVAQILESYGADPARWPLGERAQVAQALEADLKLASLRRREAALDSLLAQVPAHAPHPSLITRIRAAARAQRAAGWRGALVMLFGTSETPLLRRPASAFALAMMLGVVTGIVWSPDDDAEASAAELVTIAFAHDLLPELGSAAE